MPGKKLPTLLAHGGPPKPVRTIPVSTSLYRAQYWPMVERIAPTTSMHGF